MPLEIYVFRPGKKVSDQWRKVHTAYPGEEIQIPNVTSDGRFEMMRVQVKPDDSMTTVHTIFPEEIIIRSNTSELPSQISFDPKKSENLPHKILKGQYIEVFSRILIEDAVGVKVEEISKGRLFHR